MKWEADDIIRAILGGGFFTAITAVIANIMGWVRFGKSDRVKIKKVESETAIDLAIINEKRISDAVKVSDAALNWNVQLAIQLEKANMAIDKKQEENDRLHDIIHTMKLDFEEAFQKLKKDFNDRIKELEEEFEKSRVSFLGERDRNLNEIKILKDQIDGIVPKR